jgi:hypothetical protein
MPKGGVKSMNWQDQLQHAEASFVKSRKMGARVRTCFFPSPQEIKAQLEAIPFGETRSLAQLREHLATENGTEITCPVTTARGLKIVAEAAWESRDGSSTITPFWRVLEPSLAISKRLSCGSEFVETMRLNEGIDTQS